nr:UDP-glucuronosyltransferase [Nilaparvata lugens]
MKSSVLCMLALVVVVGKSAESANILVLMPLPFPSHTRTYMPLFKELALRGHNVTFYSAFPFKEEIPNLKTVMVDNFLEGFIHDIAKSNFADFNGWRHVVFVWRMGLTCSEKLLQQPPIKQLMQSKDTYDVILLETFFAHEYLTAFGHKFQAPIINLHPFRAENWLNFNVGNPNPFSYVADFRLEADGQMDYFQRISNLMIGLFTRVTGYYWYLPRQEATMRTYFDYAGVDTLPPLKDMLAATTMSLVDGHHAISYVAPNLPNIVPVGGIHISANSSLPEDLKKWIEDSPHGIIYLSLGSTLRSADLKREYVDIFVQVLGKLPQRILWKWEADDIPGRPDNVKISKWFPQQAILEHPKCKLFLTHGGFHGMFEAAYYGVPVVGTPVFADQKGNLHIAKRKGFGLMVKFEELTAEKLSHALNTVLNTPSFKENAQKLSKIIKDEPSTPMERAIFWVEHVIRHKGADHLKSMRLSLTWYQYLLVDIIALFVAVALVIFYVFKLLLGLLLSNSDKSSKNGQKETNKVKKN